LAQSVELLLDGAAEAAVVAQWAALRGAGLPSEMRSPADQFHRPHITLYAGDRVHSGAEEVLRQLLTGLDLRVTVGALMLFGPRRRSYIVVRHVVASTALLDLQQKVVDACRFPLDNFGAGSWTPHVTLARRTLSAQVGQVLDVLGAAAGAPLPARIRECRRWDGVRRAAWPLT
jgi:2'-5' RNA ligase